MDPTPYFVMGLMTGVAMTVFIHWFANRRVKKALAAISTTQAAPQVDEEFLLQRRETDEMRHRLAVLERIITDQPRVLEREIERLR